MTGFIGKLNDGGPFFTYPLLLLMIVIVVMIVKAAISKSSNGKSIALIKSLGWFVLAWGFLGRTFGLIMAFDNVSAHGELTPSLLAGGLKMALINPLFAIFIFLIARGGVLYLLWSKKKDDFKESGELMEA
ncbi:MotA/TolQ/ExbB proton channel family protein [Carboxylicivirga linearis]|uniref:MotA/TolQ/ExbB proton channel family protein n=1 Tax=Carboxylicivirga linearis TaxID=1628157 RepID=A0ABS5JQ80_9BACT|nr:MotA/TolQ/ExbB proton channel family protein [Carboxylicivirga linearis]MBS2097027.1 MotA/TolQ/ExbB proton channel family protein [Carboxylicivirga linearis]